MGPETNPTSTTCLQQVIDSVDCSIVLVQFNADGGSALIINKTIPHKLLNIHTNLQATAVRVTLCRRPCLCMCFLKFQMVAKQLQQLSCQHCTGWVSSQKIHVVANGRANLQWSRKDFCRYSTRSLSHRNGSQSYC